MSNVKKLQTQETKKDIIQPKVSLSAETLKNNSLILSRILSDSFKIYTKTLKYHWNVVGPEFREIHLMLEAQYEKIQKINDLIAERIRSSGYKTPGTLEEFSQLGSLEENKEQNLSWEIMIMDLTNSMEKLVSYIRSAIVICEKNYDFVTSDILIEVIRYYETQAWKLRSLTT